MDAIAEAFQIIRRKKNPNVQTLWTLFFRKEMFTPWHDPASDPVGTNLIYQQICSCIRHDEYYVREVN